MVKFRAAHIVNMPSAPATYQITPDAYGTPLRRALGWVLEFIFFAALLSLGFVLIDLLSAKHTDGVLRSQPDFLKDTLEPIFVVGGMTVLQMMSESVRKTLEVQSDSITVYDEGGIDPLYRRGTSISRSEIKGIREARLFSLFSPRPYGLMIRYGHKRWKGKRLFIPSGIGGYAELRAQLRTWALDKA